MVAHMADCVKRGWDSCLDYRKAYSQILSHLYSTGNPYDVILLVQLRNGSRVGEAVEAVKAFCSEGKNTVRVRVEKHKGNDTRLMVLPEELRNREGKDLLAKACIKLAKLKDAKNSVKVYCKQTYGFNTHSLRYAFVTYLLSKGVSPSFIAKITGHRNLSHILTYTEIKTAEDILVNVK